MISIGCQLLSTTRGVADSSLLRGLMSVGVVEEPGKLLISRGLLHLISLGYGLA